MGFIGIIRNARYLVSKYISYGASIVFPLLFTGILVSVFTYFYGITVISVAGITIPIVFITIGLTNLVHGIQFGLLDKLGIPGFPRILKVINNGIKNDEIRDDLSPEELEELLKALVRVPVVNAISAFFYVLVIGMVAIVSELIFNKNPQIKEILITIGMLGVLHSMFAYLTSELATGRMRSSAKRLLKGMGYDIPRYYVMSVSTKLSFFIILLLISTYISDTLMYNFKKAGLVNVLAFTGISVLMFILLAGLISYSIYSSLREIEEAAIDLENGGRGEIYTRSLDKEFVEVASVFSHAAEKVVNYKEDLEREVAERTRELRERDELIRYELMLAKDIQKGILPTKFPEWEGIRITARYIAMEDVSGDFYDVFHLPGDRLGVLIADVSGHGIPAALITTMAKIAFVTAVQKYHTPKEIFRAVNEKILEYVKTQDYLTAFMVVIDSEHNIVYANAGHQRAKLYRYRDNEIKELDTDGLLIGAIEEASETYQESTDKLYPGDRIFLYTDGIVEAKNKNREEFGHQRFNELILKSRNLTIDEAAELIWNSVKEHIGDNKREDDITLLILEVNPNYEELKKLLEDSERFRRENKPQEALEALKKALAISPEDLRALQKMGIFLYKLGRYRESIDYLLKYLNINPNNYEVLFAVSNCYLNLGELDKALDYAKKAYAIERENLSVLNLLSLIYFKLGDYEKAYSYISEAYSLISERDRERKERIEEEKRKEEDEERTKKIIEKNYALIKRYYEKNVEEKAS